MVKEVFYMKNYVGVAMKIILLPNDEDVVTASNGVAGFNGDRYENDFFVIGGNAGGLLG